MGDLIAAGEVFRNALAWICLRGAVVLFAALALWQIGKVAGAPISDFWRKLTAAGRAFVCAMLLVGVIYGGGKTNNVPPNMNQPLPQMQQGGGSFLTGFTGFTGLSGVGNLVNLVNPVQTTSEDIARGYRVESVATNAAPFAAMPSNAVEYAVWSQRGGRETWFPLGLGDFVLPLGTNRVSRLRVLSGGMVETFPALNGPGSVCAAREAASLVPGVSRFWCADAEGGAKVLRWDGVFAGRDGTDEYTAEMRFFPNGDFTTRSNEVETVCRRVNPDDWDGDGIANDIDLSPLVCDGEFFGPSNILPEGANTNAYCSVALVATGPDALIAFEGDGPSNYPDPYFVAKSGETNEVVILIGKTYVISSDWPFAIVGVSDPETEVWTVRGAAHQTSVCRPVTITSSGGNPFKMSVAPANLGGMFAWQPTMCSCSLSGSGTSFSWNCPTDCTCCGCAAEGLYSYEGYGLPATSCLCGCHYDGTGPTWEPSSAPLAASVSATFSKSAVIFEDAYENEPGKWGVRNPTRTRLNVVANGGPNGATLSVAATNLGKLGRISGPDLPLAPVSVPAETQVSYSIVYEGEQASATTNDVVVAAMLAENGTGIVSTNTACMTSVRVELEADHAAPANTNLHRHVFGVLESFHYRQYPSSAFAEWYFSEGTQELIPFSPGYIILPPTTNQTSGGDCSFYVTCGDVAYTNAFQMMLPRVEARNPRYNESLTMVQGDAGWLLLHLDLYVGPSYVSFEGIDFVEIPDESGNCPHGGYYNDVTKGGYLSHCAAAGAGRWYTVNSQGYWCSDLAGRGGRYDQPWADGWKEWPIPVGWGIDERLRAQFDRPPTTQKFTLTVDGTFSIRKYGFEATRDTLNHVMIRGVEGE